MSRIGKMPIEVAAGVTVTVGANNEVTVKGPKGELSAALNQDMIIEQNGNVIEVSVRVMQKSTELCTVLQERFLITWLLV